MQSKMGENKNIPQIRFIGFSGTWEERKLDDISDDKYGGGTPKTSVESYWNGSIPWIQSSDLTEDELSNVYPRKFISEAGLRHSATKLVPQNSIAIITRVGVGKLAYMPFSYTTSQDYLSLSKLNIDAWFSVYSIYKKIKGELNAVQGTSIKGITKDELLSKCILIPNNPKEQSQIGTYFQNLDKLITLQQQKHDKLVTLKKAMLDKMFPKEGADVPEIRFKGFEGVWEEKKLGDVTHITTGKLDANAMKKDGKYDFYTSGIQKYKIDVYAFAGPAITIAGNGATVGYMHFANGLFNAYQRTYVLFDFTENREFLYFEISKVLPLKIKEEARSGNIPYIVLEMLTDLKIKTPSLKEQSQIGSFFHNLDKLISLQQQEIQKLKNIKKACLEKMFV